MKERTNAPLSELRVASNLRTYERIKLGLLIVVLGTLLAMGTYLIGIGQANRIDLKNGTETLSILRCAVDPTVQIDEHGKPRTEAEARKAFNRCVTAAKKEK